MWRVPNGRQVLLRAPVSGHAAAGHTHAITIVVVSHLRFIMFTTEGYGLSKGSSALNWMAKVRTTTDECLEREHCHTQELSMGKVCLCRCPHTKCPQFAAAPKSKTPPAPRHRQLHGTRVHGNEPRQASPASRRSWIELLADEMKNRSNQKYISEASSFEPSATSRSRFLELVRSRHHGSLKRNRSSGILCLSLFKHLLNGPWRSRLALAWVSISAPHWRA